MGLRGNMQNGRMALTGPSPARHDEHMIDSADYQIHLDSTGPKTGFLTSEDDLPKLEVSSPPEFGGPGMTWSPEHLFVAAISSCLMTTFRTIAALSNLEVLDYSDDATGHLVREASLYRIESVTLRPRVVVADANQVERALRILGKAEHACLVSRSVSSATRVDPTVEVARALAADTASE